MVKTLFKSLKQQRYLRVNIFKFFLTVLVYSTIDDDKTLKVLRNKHKDSRSVEIFGISTTILDLKAF
jgi:hypothetical protein